MINYSKYQKGCCEYDTLLVSNFITLCEFLQCTRLLSIPDHGLEGICSVGSFHQYSI